jgi:uncharacterized membrane protein
MGNRPAGILRTLGEFVGKNFATPIAFFVVFESAGPRPAIAVAVAIALGQLALHLVLRHRISPFFLTASAFTVLFGSMDFLVAEPQFFKLEPFAENVAIGILFAVTVALGKPIALWFAQALPAFIRPELGPDAEEYLRKVTLGWIAYFILKALLFLWLAYQVDLGQLILLRSAIGGATLVLMLGGEVFYRKRIRGRRQAALS